MRKTIVLFALTVLLCGCLHTGELLSKFEKYEGMVRNVRNSAAIAEQFLLARDTPEDDAGLKIVQGIMRVADGYLATFQRLREANQETSAEAETLFAEIVNWQQAADSAIHTQRKAATRLPVSR